MHESINHLTLKISQPDYVAKEDLKYHYNNVLKMNFNKFTRTKD